MKGSKASLLLILILLGTPVAACHRRHKHHRQQANAASHLDAGKGTDSASVYKGRDAGHDQSEVSGHNWRLGIEVHKRDKDGRVTTERRSTEP